MADTHAASVISAAYVFTAEENVKLRKTFRDKGPVYLQIDGSIVIVFALVGPMQEVVSRPKLFLLGILLILMRPLFQWAQKSRMKLFTQVHPEGIPSRFKFS